MIPLDLTRKKVLLFWVHQKTAVYCAHTHESSLFLRAVIFLFAKMWDSISTSVCAFAPEELIMLLSLHNSKQFMVMAVWKWLPPVLFFYFLFFLGQTFLFLCNIMAFVLIHLIKSTIFSVPQYLIFHRLELCISKNCFMCMFTSEPFQIYFKLFIKHTWVNFMYILRILYVLSMLISIS